MRTYESLPPKARRLAKWGSIGLLLAVGLGLVLMTFLEFWTAFFIALGLYLALFGPLNAAARKEHLQMLRDRNRA